MRNCCQPFLVFFVLLVLQGEYLCAIEKARKIKGYRAKTEESEGESNKRALLIFLDALEPYTPTEVSIDYVDTGGGITNDCLAAILTKASPLLVSGPILYNLFSLPQVDAEKNKNFVRAVGNLFDQDDWIIRKVKHNNLYCMMTKDYLADQERKSIFFKKIMKEGHKKTGRTALEYQLGLQFDHMEPVPVHNAAQGRAYFAERYSDGNPGLREKISFDFIDSLKDIFVLNADYEKNEFSPPEWFVYLTGHGWYGMSIAQLTFEQFTELLNFLERKIKTAFFVYSSCYATGYNAQQVYGELTKIGGVKTYPFVIATQAVSDAQTLTGYIKLENGKIISRIRFDLFIKSLLESSTSYEEALTHIILDIKRQYFKSEIPQIRFPHVPAWFPVTESDKAVVSITETMAKTRMKPLVINPYEFEGQQKDPMAILLYTDQVSFPVHINTMSMPTLILMASGRVDCKIKELTATNISTQNFFESTKKVRYGVAKDIFIEKVITKDDVLNNVLIEYFIEWLVAKDGGPNNVTSSKRVTYSFDSPDSAQQRKGFTTGPEGKPDVERIDLTLPEKYRKIAWRSHAALHEIMSKKAIQPEIVKQSIALRRLSKANELIKLSFYPKLGRDDKQRFRFLLQRVEKKEECAICYIRQILQALINGESEKALSLVKQAYGRRMPVGYDVIVEEFEEKRWEKALLFAVGGSDFDFLD